jgi:hypothetical protein
MVSLSSSLGKFGRKEMSFFKQRETSTISLRVRLDVDIEGTGIELGTNTKSTLYWK